MTVPSIRTATTKDAQAISAARLSGWRAPYGPLLPPETLDGIDAAAWARRLPGRLESGRKDILEAGTRSTRFIRSLRTGRAASGDR